MSVSITLGDRVEQVSFVISESIGREVDFLLQSSLTSHAIRSLRDSSLIHRKVTVLKLSGPSVMTNWRFTTPGPVEVGVVAVEAGVVSVSAAV